MNYDKSKYNVWRWYHISKLFWFLNPFGFIYDLVFGRRIAKVTLEEKKKSSEIPSTLYIPCPHCETIHSSLKWSPQNDTGLGNWFGLYCDHCNKIIPCIGSLTSWIVLGITFPVWYFFIDKWRIKWLEIQKEKFNKELYLAEPVYPWWYEGIIWGLMMSLAMFVIDIFPDENEFTLSNWAIKSISWIIGGLVYGLIIRHTLKKQVVINRLKSQGRL